MPAKKQIHIVMDRYGRPVDASKILNQLYRLDRFQDWSHPQTQQQIDELAGRLISATGSRYAPAVLVARLGLGRHVTAAFRAHLKVSWKRVAETCEQEGCLGTAGKEKGRAP